jgi:dihydrolipoamide dehydrogenase
MAENFDVVVIGGGPGGYVAAIRAAQLGMRTALVEAKHLGGICLNWGCIPTKTLLRSAELYRSLQHLDQYGLSAGNPSFDIKKIVARSRAVATQLSGGISHLMKKNKITVFNGFGKLEGAGKIHVEAEGKVTHQLQAKHIILATGAKPRQLPGFEPDGERIWTYREAMVPEAMPKSLIIVGSGAIGMEFASFYNAFGVAVTVLEALPRILMAEDEEISALARKSFEKQGIVIHTEVKLISATIDKKQVTLQAEWGSKTHTLQADRLIMAVGVTGNTEGLGLEKTKVKIEKGQIVTDSWLQTAEPGVYAIGDVTSGPWLAHKASHEAVICVERIAGIKDIHPLRRDTIPGCTYTSPQIASVGLNEAKAKEAGRHVKIGRFPFMGNGKAIALGEPEGLVKVVFDAKTGELLGAHMIGAEVTELIQGYVITMTMEGTELDLMHSIFPHPTLSEMMHESALDAYGKVLHM